MNLYILRITQENFTRQTSETTSRRDCTIHLSYSNNDIFAQLFGNSYRRGSLPLKYIDFTAAILAAQTRTSWSWDLNSVSMKISAKKGCILSFNNTATLKRGFKPTVQPLLKLICIAKSNRVLFLTRSRRWCWFDRTRFLYNRLHHINQFLKASRRKHVVIRTSNLP